MTSLDIPAANSFFRSRLCSESVHFLSEKGEQSHIYLLMNFILYIQFVTHCNREGSSTDIKSHSNTSLLPVSPRRIFKGFFLGLHNTILKGSL